MSSKLAEQVEGGLSHCHPMASQVTAYHCAGPATASPTMKINGRIVLYGPIDLIQDRNHTFHPRNVHIPNGQVHQFYGSVHYICQSLKPVLIGNKFLSLEIVFVSLHEIYNVANAVSKKILQFCLSRSRISATWIVAGEKFSWHNPV